MTPPKDDPSDPSSPAALLRLADQCVKCGYCLPVCPTYAKTRHEAESPRGRIALIQGWLDGRLELSPQLVAHLERCLLCRACESACPSAVAYGRLMDGARARRVAALPRWRRLAKGLWLGALTQAHLLRLIARLARLYARLFGGKPPRPEAMAHPSLPVRPPRPPAWGQFGSRLRAIDRVLKALAHTARPVAHRSPQAADIDLFVGCSGSALQGRALAATLAVCNRLGIQVRIPRQSPCCGALYRHEGLVAAAERSLGECARLYEGRTLVGLASACIAELRTDARLSETWELCDYLDRLSWPHTLRLEPLPERVLVHEPCSHRHLLGGNASVWRLLGRIPQIQLLGLPESARCCGAAGVYFLKEPQMSLGLLNDLLAQIQALAPAIIVTTNPGCALHLLAGIRESGLKIEVCHPIELIARQLGEALD